ncbi:MAG: helix-turn-helix domain-containing protein [Clostridiales bacterium]
MNQHATHETNLKMLRVKFGNTQKDMSELLKLSRIQYAKKERGKAKFSLDEAKVIANYFMLPIEDIFFNDILKKIEPM